MNTKPILPIIFGLSIFTFEGCAIKKLSSDMGNPKWGVEVVWHGHSCFTLKDSVGRTLAIDPFDETVGYGRIRLRADALLVTHRHFDHDYVKAVKPRLLDLDLVESSGTVVAASGLLVTGLSAYHDAERGEIHGSNLVYTFAMGGVRCLHLGDMGQQTLTQYQRKLIGVVDVLFIPVGGVTTINAQEAKTLVDEIKPSAVFPMHYGDIRFYPLDGVEKFLSLFRPEQIKRINGSAVRIRESDRQPDPVVYVLTPADSNF